MRQFVPHGGSSLRLKAVSRLRRMFMLIYAKVRAVELHQTWRAGP